MLGNIKGKSVGLLEAIVVTALFTNHLAPGEVLFIENIICVNLQESIYLLLWCGVA